MMEDNHQNSSLKTYHKRILKNNNTGNSWTSTYEKIVDIIAKSRWNSNQEESNCTKWKTEHTMWTKLDIQMNTCNFLISLLIQKLDGIINFQTDKITCTMGAEIFIKY